MSKNYDDLKKMYRIITVILSGAITIGILGSKEKIKPNTKQTVVEEYAKKHELILGEEETPGYFEVREENANNSLHVSLDEENSSKKRVKYIELADLNKELNLGQVTWDDVKSAIQSNENITDDIKEILCKGINNLIKWDISFDLTALYLNMLDLKIVVANVSDLYNGTTVGVFEKEEHVAKIDTNEYKRVQVLKEMYDTIDPMFNIEADESEVLSWYSVYFHEILGHGSMCYYKSGENVDLCAINFSEVYKYNQIENVNYMNKSVLGNSLQEYLSDKISFYAQNKSKHSSISAYSSFNILYDIIGRSLNISFGELINGGEEVLLQKARVDSDERAETYMYDVIKMLDKLHREVALEPKNAQIRPYDEYINEVMKNITLIKLIQGASIEEIEEKMEKVMNKSFKVLHMGIVMFIKEEEGLNRGTMITKEQFIEKAMNGVREAKEEYNNTLKLKQEP